MFTQDHSEFGGCRNHHWPCSTFSTGNGDQHHHHFQYQFAVQLQCWFCTPGPRRPKNGSLGRISRLSEGIWCDTPSLMHHSVPKNRSPGRVRTCSDPAPCKVRGRFGKPRRVDDLVLILFHWKLQLDFVHCFTSLGQQGFWKENEGEPVLSPSKGDVCEYYAGCITNCQKLHPYIYVKRTELLFRHIGHFTLLH